MNCRPGCGACCIAPSISSSIPGMPGGKPAGVRCAQLTAENRCLLFGRPERPAVCVSLRPSLEMCGGGAGEAMERLMEMERETKPNPPRSPQPPSLPPCQGGRKAPSLPLYNANTTTPSPDKGRAGEGLGRAGEGLACLPYNKNLVPLARENRRNPTPAETRIWNEVLRKRQLAQFKFLRQKPLDHFIVDFYCSKLGLVIEIDGDSHAETAEYDHERTRVLGAYGLEVVRYTNDEVLRNIEGVYEDLLRRISNLPRSANPPQSPQPPSIPPCQGGRKAPSFLLDNANTTTPSPDKGRAGEGLENAGEGL